MVGLTTTSNESATEEATVSHLKGASNICDKTKSLINIKNLFRLT